MEAPVLAGSRGQLIKRILGEEEVNQDRGVFQLDAPIDRLSDALFRYGRALTRICDLTLHSRSRATSTFYDDLADLLFQAAGEDRIQRDHLLPDLPNAEAYPIDYRMEGKSGGQVFLYGVPNRDKARLTTIILSHFRRNHLDFDSRRCSAPRQRISPCWRTPQDRQLFGHVRRREVAGQTQPARKSGPAAIPSSVSAVYVVVRSAMSGSTVR